jgi:protein-tyrosine phosphatase
MVDIHTHLVFDVDDGAKDIKTSVAILQDEASQGVTHIVATPHYRKGMFKYHTGDVEMNFKLVRDRASAMGLHLYLGCEFHVHQEILDYIRNGRVHTMGDSRYMLMEYRHNSEYDYIVSSAEEMILSGYHPVIAHAERYSCIQKNPDRLRELRAMGAMIQINADSVLGAEGHGQKSLCKKILKEELGDIIASDVHDMRMRPCRMRQCYDYLEKKYGRDTAERYLVERPMRIIQGITGERFG